MTTMKMMFLLLCICTQILLASAVVGHHPTILKLQRHNQLPSGRAFEFPVKGAGQYYLGGPYLIRLSLGNPPQDFNLIIDTGSSVIWVPCQTSTGVGRTPAFNPRLSSPSSLTCSDGRCKAADIDLSKCNNSANSCVYDLNYGLTSDTSSGTSGYYISDLVHLDSFSTPARIAFGCSTSFAGQLEHRAFDGVLGMGAYTSSISQLNAVGISGMLFTLCLASSGNGILALGEATESGLVYTPLIPAKNYYQINLEGIAVNGQKLSIDSSVFRPSRQQYTFADSRTTFALLADGAFDPFVNAVDESKYCIAWIRNTGKQVTLLGDIVFVDKLIVHDMEKMRMGWMNYDCSGPVNITATHGKKKVNSGQASHMISLPDIATILMFCMVLHI